MQLMRSNRDMSTQCRILRSVCQRCRGIAFYISLEFLKSEATMLQIVAECLRTQRMRNPLVRAVISHDKFFIVTGWPTLQPVTINSCRPAVYDFQLHRGMGNQHCTSLTESPNTCRNYITQENTCMLVFVCASTASKTSLRVACLEHAHAESAQVLVAAGATA